MLARPSDVTAGRLFRGVNVVSAAEKVQGARQV